MGSTNVTVQTPVQSRIQAPVENNDGFVSRIGQFLSRLSTPLINIPRTGNGLVDFGEQAVEGLTSPIGIATTALAPVTGGFSLGLGGLAGTGARLGTRLAVEGLVGAGAGLAAEKAQEALPTDTNPFIKGAVGLGAGALAGIGSTAALRSVLPHAAEDLVARAAKLAEGTTSQDAGILTEAIANAKTVPTSQQKQILAVQRQAQAAKFAEVSNAARASGASAQEAIAAGDAATKGGFQRAQFGAPEITPEQAKSLYDQGFNFYADKGMNESTHTIRDALDKVLAGAVPPPHELRALEEVYGSGMVEALRLHRGFGAKLVEALNFPRALVASADLSAPLRQGIMLAAGHPISFAKNFIPMVRAFADDGYYKQAVAALNEAPEAARAEIAGLARTAGKTVGKEESFIGNAVGKNSSLASSLMGASERAYSLYLDKLRRDVFNNFTKKLDSTGAGTLSSEKEYAAFLNRATGRGSEKYLEGNLGKVANAAFFAPNFTMSRFLAPTSLVTADPAVRKQVAKDLGAFVAAGVGGLTLLNQAGKAGILPVSVEADPRSSDFGKVKIGNTRYDFWGGYQQIARAIAQTATAQTKSPTSGRISDANRAEIIGRFIQSKLSPAAGLLVDVTRGETFSGDRVDITPDSLTRQAVSRLTPLVAQDVAQGFAEGGTRGAIQSLPSFFGVGTSTFQSLSGIKNDVANRLFSKEDYRDLTGAQKQVVDNDPRVLEKNAQYDGKAGDDYSTQAQRIADTRLKGQQAFVAQLVSQNLTRKQFADAIEENDRSASIARDQARRDFKIPDAAAPTSALQMGLDAYYRLFDQADLGAPQGVKTGQIDWDKYEVLKNELYKNLSTEQQDFIDARAKAEHDPLTDWYYNNKEYLGKSGYYDVSDTAFAPYIRRAQSINPDIQSYGDLLAAMDQTKVTNPSLYKRLNVIENQVSAKVDDQHQKLRRKDPKLDAALYTLGRTSTVLTPAAKRIVGQLDSKT